MPRPGELQLEKMCGVAVAIEQTSWTSLSKSIGKVGIGPCLLALTLFPRFGCVLIEAYISSQSWWKINIWQANYYLLVKKAVPQYDAKMIW